MTIDYSGISRLSQIWPIVAEKFPDFVALHNPHSKPEVKITYSQLWEKIQYFAAGLQALGLEKEDKISIFADNSPRWLIADQGTMTAGAVNAVRSATADVEELLYILKDSDSVALIVEDVKTFKKLQPHLSDIPLRFIILLCDETSGDLINYQQVLELGSTSSLTPYEGTIESLATLIYTSGTTGQPKGVMLSHKNLLHQVVNLKVFFKPEPGDCILSILPSWHSYERSCEYYLLSQGCKQVYTNIRSLKNDLKDYQPYLMVGVPRIWESLYEGIQKQFQQYPANKQKLIYTLLDISENYILNQRLAQSLSVEHLNASSGERLIAGVKSAFLRPFYLLADQIIYKSIRSNLGNLKTLTSGGGALAKHLDTFFEIIGIPLLVGYGLTETSPVVTARSVEHNFRGTAGQPITYTEIKIVHPETRQPLPFGETGIVLVRGPQVMQGYYKKPEATAKVIDADGWFDTGDLGWITVENDLILTGRIKDTIVLSNGENIEPEPLETACIRSPYIEQIVIVGQDQKSLSALIVPNLETLKNWAKQEKLSLEFPEKNTDPSQLKESDLYNKIVLEKFRQELNKQIKNRPGYRPDDQIKAFEFIVEPFSGENGMMTQTLKIKRPVVMEHYHDIIIGMFDQ